MWLLPQGGVGFIVTLNAHGENVAWHHGCDSHADGRAVKP